MAAAAQAATVELANGYSLEGTITARDEKVLHFDSALMGPLDIPLTNVAKITGDVAAADKAPTPPPPAVAKASPAEPVVTTPAKSDIDSLLERFYFLENWKTDLALGLGYVSGETDSSSSSLSFSTERKWTRRELRFEIIQQYEKATDADGGSSVSKDSLKALGRYRNDFSERFFWQSETQYGYDNVKEIDYDLRESLGLGWRVIKTERMNLALTPALSIQKKEVGGESKDLIYAPTFFEEFTFDLTKGTSFRQDLSILFPVNGDDGNSYHFSLKMKSMLSEHLSFNLLYLYDYDGSVADKIEPGQHSMNVLLGVSF
jgi:putative salt-induced outer membrane protein YdiY